MKRADAETNQHICADARGLVVQFAFKADNAAQNRGEKQAGQQRKLLRSCSMVTSAERPADSTTGTSRRIPWCRSGRSEFIHRSLSK